MVVLIHNQGHNLARLLPAYQAQTQQPDLTVFVCDRCQDDSVTQLQAFAVDVPALVLEVDHQGSNFQAGRNRDLGLEAAEEALGACDVVYLDGDCVPEPGLLAGFLAVFAAAGDYPTVVSGRRVNENAAGTGFDEDNRLRMPQAYATVFASGMHRLMVAKEPAMSRLATWSCCLGLNHRAVTLQRQVNKRIDNHAVVFNDGFNGRWGGEDDFVGIVAVYMGMALVFLDPDTCYVHHIYHVSRSNNEYTSMIGRRMTDIKRLSARLRMPGVCFARARTSVLDTEIDRNAETECGSAILEYALKDNPKQNVLVQVLAVHCVLTGPRKPSVRHADLHPYRVALESVKHQKIDAVAVLPTLRYQYELPVTEAACNICNSTRGFDSQCRCRGCMSQAWHRIAQRVLGEVRYGLVTNPEPRGEKMLFQGWQTTNYNQDHINLEKLPFPDRSFPAVFSGHVLEHVLRDDLAIQELARVVSDYGVVVLALPTTPGRTAEDVTDRLSKRERIQRFHWHDHYRIYGVNDLQDRLRVNGLDPEFVTAADVGGVPGVPDDEFVLVCKPINIDVQPPKRLYLDVFSSCNYKCVTCSIHKLEDKGGVDLDTYRSAIDEFKALHGREVHFQSGETWLRRALVLQIANYARSIGLYPHLVTNGSGIHSEHAQALNVFESVCISVDSTDAAEHDTKRGTPGAFEHALSAAASLKDVTKVLASMVLTQERILKFRAYAETMLAHGFDAVGFNVLEPEFAAPAFESPHFYVANRITDPDLFQAEMLACLNHFPSGKLTFTKQDIDDISNSLRGKPGCVASSTSILLDRNHRVQLCSHKPVLAEYAPGKLAEIWNGKHARLRREQDRTCDRNCATGNCNRR